MLIILTLLVSFALAFPLQKSANSSSNGTLYGIISGQEKLTFNSEGTFKIVAFSDMHFGERNGNGTFAEWGPPQDAQTQNVHAVIEDMEKPDFVVFNGDLVTGENLGAGNATAYLDLVFAPTVNRSIPFASTHGNHDNSDFVSHRAEIDYEMKNYANKKSYTRSDVGLEPWGVGNYWVPVYANSSAQVPALIMWFLDSQSFVSGTGSGPGPVPANITSWVDEKTVPEYISSQATLMRQTFGFLPPCIVFVHIPFEVSNNIWQLPSAGVHDDEPDPSVQGFINQTYTGNDFITFSQLVGLNEGVGKVTAIVSGHDHGENYCVRSFNSSGVVVCFDGHSGYGGYSTNNTMIRDGRVFNFALSNLTQEYPSVESWISYENQTTADHITLDKDYFSQYL